MSPPEKAPASTQKSADAPTTAAVPKPSGVVVPRPGPGPRASVPQMRAVSALPASKTAPASPLPPPREPAASIPQTRASHVELAAPAPPAKRPAANTSPTLIAPASVAITTSPRVSDPGFSHIANAVQGRDPEASLDIPPPAELVPPEDRPPGSTDPYIGTTFDHRYKILQLLGEGGMGFVYLARHKVIDKKVAVKVLRADLAKDREILDRFLQEAKAASSIGNPHIVDISDFGDLPDGSTYFVMEFLEGEALSDRMDSGERIPIDRILHVGLQICDGLAAAHARGIVHRDLKPDNVHILERGSDHDFVKILDFGIAKVSGNANTKLTKAGAVFGTPHYMSPEQAAGAPVDHRTDIYALGVMLYEMVAGQLPFNADNFMGILTQHMYKAPVPIRALVPGPECPPSFEAVILKCLSKKPEARYQSMEELAADLERVKSGSVATAVTEMMARSGGFNVPADYFKQPSVLVPATPPTPRKKWPGYVWVLGAAAPVGLAVVIFVISSISNGTPKVANTVPAATTTAAVPATASVAATAPPAPKKITVAVAATPDTAVGYSDDGASHELPWTVEVEDGKTVAIEIRAEGYETEKLALDGTETSKKIKLKPAKAVRPAAVKASGGAPRKAPKRNGDVVDPWGK